MVAGTYSLVDRMSVTTRLAIAMLAMAAKHIKTNTIGLRCKAKCCYEQKRCHLPLFPSTIDPQLGERKRTITLRAVDGTTFFMTLKMVLPMIRKGGGTNYCRKIQTFVDQALYACIWAGWEGPGHTGSTGIAGTMWLSC